MFPSTDSIFFVQVSKGSRGLGFSVSGGSDSSAPYPGLIRIKRLFPHQAAWATGMLQPGDILLEANGVPLTGLTNYLALEILRKATNVVTLTVCRPKDEQYRKLSPPTEPPRPPLRNALSYDQGHGSSSVPQSPLPVAIPFQQQQQQQQIHHFFPPANARNTQLQSVAAFLPSLDPIQTNFSGEFEIVLTKQQGSLGFTLRKEDESVLGHYVRALVREPALSDGRIRPGDKIVAVNDVPVSSMTHEEAVIFLRQAADVVRLRLYRDQAQTPLSAQSPIEPSIRGRTRMFLRPEAINLLSELAANRFHRAAAGSGSSVASSHTNSPRRLRRVGAHQAGFDNHGFQQHSNDTFNYSDSCSNASTIVSQAMDDLEESYYCDEEIDAIVASEDKQSNGDEHGPRPRPTFLDLDAGARFQLAGTGAAAVQQLNNLDRDTLNAPLRYGLGGPGTPGLAGPDPDGPNFVSLPCETFLVACKTEQDLQTSGDQTEAIYVQHFAHKSPLYSSVNVPSRVGAAELVEAVERGGKKSLMKWKGATLLGDEEVQDEPMGAAEQGAQQPQDSLITPDADDSSMAATAGTTLSTATPTTERELFDLNASCGTDSEGNQIFTVELNKGWNSRLGFSLKQDTGPTGSIRTVISAIYRDSVAARDGRLRVGDVLIMVNEESVEAVPTAQVIELMRIVRGSIFITLMRPSGAGSSGSTLEPTPEEPDEPTDASTVIPVQSNDCIDADIKQSVISSTAVAKQEATSEEQPAELDAERQ
uniref:PDZ domain-containing protein n=1 Tax=Anopheles maculatus TaxID=74869 RepID=A0A182S5Y3_9DIPT